MELVIVLLFIAVFLRSLDGPLDDLQREIKDTIERGG